MVLYGYSYLPDRTASRENVDMLQLDDIWTTSDRFDTPTEKIVDPVPVLYQSGYLTIKSYNRLAKLYKLAFPNEEVRKGFSNSLFRYYAPDGMGDRDAIYMAWAKNFILSAEDNMEAFLLISRLSTRSSHIHWSTTTNAITKPCSTPYC